MAVEMLSYIERESPLHRLSGATKLIIFLFWSTAAMLTYDTRILLVMLIGSLVIFKISQIKLREIAFVLIFILFFLMLNNVAIYIFSPRQGVEIYGTSHELFHIWGRYNMTWEQIFYQSNVTLKYFVVIPAALLFIVTTHPSEFAASLSRIGISYKISYAVSLAFRYIPDIQRDYKTISKAQQARGIDLSRNEKLGRRLKNALAIIMPLIMSSLDRIETISNAMELRGFGKKKRRSWYSEKSFRKADVWAIFFTVILFVIAMIVTFYDGSRFYNPFK